MQSVSSASTSLEPLQPARWSLAPMAQKQLEQNQLIDLALSKRPKKSQVKTLSPHIHAPSLVAYKDGAWGSSPDQASKSSQDRKAVCVPAVPCWRMEQPVYGMDMCWRPQCYCMDTYTRASCLL